MKPISFHEQEVNYTSTEPDIDPLPVLRVTYAISGRQGLVSCWKPSLRDVFRLIIGRPIFLTIYGGIQPPVAISTSREETLGPGQ